MQTQVRDGRYNSCPVQAVDSKAHLEQGVEARNRKLTDWYGKIQRSEIKLPRFQRFEAWDRHRICSLIETVVRDLPLGITLILEVDKEKFVSRYLETAPHGGDRVHEHLLDGQQRLTALWRVFHNNYEHETYFVYLAEFDNYAGDEERDNLTAYCKGRYTKKGELYPLWCNDPAQCLKRGFIPTPLLRPEDIHSDIDSWIERATAEQKPRDDIVALEKFLVFRKRVSDRVRDLRAVIANYNLPYLSLPAHTEKSVALDVFINLNTNSKPLSAYDIIVAEVESAMGRSLHDLESALDKRHPEIARFVQPSNIILTTSALLQNQPPSQRGAWEMDKRLMVEHWEVMERGLGRMAAFLRAEGVCDERRLPTNAVLAVIAALFTYIPETGDKRGKDELLLKKYLWHAFFTDRYENAASSRAFADFVALRGMLRDEQQSAPVFSDHEFADTDELLIAEWPNRMTIRGRGVLAACCRLGALDFSTGTRLDVNNIEQRHYHHIYPNALLAEAEIDGSLALNCALIADQTNWSIGRKEPLRYLKDRYKWTTEEIVSERLQSHLIPIAELANGGYEGLSETAKTEKLRRDFDAFIRRRAELVIRTAKLLAQGRQLSPASIFAT